MHLTLTRRLASVAAVATVAMLSACSDGVQKGITAPNAPPTLRGELAPGGGYTSICKSGPAGTYHFTVSVSGGGDYTLPRGTSFDYTLNEARTADNPSCGYLYLPQNAASWVGVDPATVTLTEVDLATGMTVASVRVYANGLLYSSQTGVTSGVAHSDYDDIWLIKFENVYTPPPPGGEGCTPGFWKNSVGSWPPTGYAPSMDFDATFGVNLFDPNISLMTALGLQGGGKYALARHATAGLLAAAHPDVDYPLTVAEVRTLVQNAVTSGDYEGAKNQLAMYNELGCPLANDNSF